MTAAAKQVRERGTERIALANVMSDAGLTHGGFYAHFGSKDDFLQATVERMFADSPFAMLRDPDRSPRQALSDFVEYYLSPEHRDTRVDGCPLPFLSAEAPRLRPELRELLSDSTEKMMNIVGRHLDVLGHSDPEGEASSCVAEMIGAVILSRAEPDRSRSDAILERTRTAVLRRFGLLTA
ncbi:TetR/AcrR family transcriptional regulator [Rhizobium wenxiniae]|uniref:TetR/AcrR family transcriptional regulator n=1 Tax=Rhizobium wenxiniae TaxID=1737357 RepID=UPI003C1EB706